MLSNEEQAELEAWYAQMDAEEVATLNFTEDLLSVEDLRARLNKEIQALQQTVENIQAIHAHNETLRQEIAILKRRLAEKQPQLVR